VFILQYQKVKKHLPNCLKIAEAICGSTFMLSWPGTGTLVKSSGVKLV
jgi:hypothetical protein